MRTMQWLVLSLIAVAGVFGLTPVAQQQQLAQPVTEITIAPENPTVNSDITVELSGTFPNTCVPDSAKATVEFNQVTIHTSNMSGFCAEGQTKWNLSVPLEKRLEAGPYRVVVLFSMEEDPEEYLLLGMKRLDVSGGGGALGDQAGQPGPLVPFTVSVRNQSRPNEPWVPGPLFVSNLNSSKANLNRTFPTLPATIGVPKGDEPLLSTKINTSKSHTFRIIGCQGSDVKIIDDCTRPPIKEIKLEITGDDPILTLLAEQTELPDLTVDIRAIIVRRYTEREQVFCDILVLTTVRNGGKGSVGVVLLGITKSQSNTYRYGLGAGASATKTEILTRVPRGLYQFEAEVKSLSIGETNTANNQATQSVMCL